MLYTSVYTVEQARFSINFLQGQNCFDQNVEGPNAQNWPAPPSRGLRRRLSVLSAGVEIQKRGHSVLAARVKMG